MLAKITKNLNRVSTRHMSTSVYLWSAANRIAGSKTGSAQVKYEMPKGAPKRIEAFDSLDVQTIRIGLRHSAVITKEG